MDRREFLSKAGTMLGVLGTPQLLGEPEAAAAQSDSAIVTLALCGDVMTGRGIDQILPYPSDPKIHEPYVKDARRYVELAENVNGPVPQAMEPSYIWGDALEALDRLQPTVRIINLETAITLSDDHWPGKGIHYRMHPGNIGCLTAAEIDCCVLANNHTLDWGYRGLTETLETLDRSEIRHAGAGRNRDQAQRPAVFDLPVGRRLLVFSVGVGSSGIPPAWAASADRPGMNLLPTITEEAVTRLVREIESMTRPGDLVVLSIHWGDNWGYEIPEHQQRLAHRVVDEAGVRVVHGHSSHHPKSIEVYRGSLVLYGCGDFLNDYEGIGGYERFRPDLTLLYLVGLDAATGDLMHLHMLPFQVRRFRLDRAGRGDAQWIQETLNRVTGPLGPELTMRKDDTLALRL